MDLRVKTTSLNDRLKAFGLSRFKEKYFGRER